jgi:hypothetical protein
VSRPFTGWRTPAVITSFVLLFLLIADRFSRQPIAVRRSMVGAAFAVVIGLALSDVAAAIALTRRRAAVQLPTRTFDDQRHFGRHHP